MLVAPERANVSANGRQSASRSVHGCSRRRTAVLACPGWGSARCLRRPPTSNNCVSTVCLSRAGRSVPPARSVIAGRPLFHRRGLPDGIRVPAIAARCSHLWLISSGGGTMVRLTTRRLLLGAETPGSDRDANWRSLRITFNGGQRCSQAKRERVRERDPWSPLGRCDCRKCDNW